MGQPGKSIFDYMDKVEDAPIEMPKKPPVLDRIEYDDKGHKKPIYKDEK